MVKSQPAPVLSLASESCIFKAEELRCLEVWGVGRGYQPKLKRAEERIIVLKVSYVFMGLEVGVFFKVCAVKELKGVLEL